MAVDKKRNTQYEIHNKVIGFVTCQKYMDMTPDEQALKLALAELGIQAVAVAWDDPEVDWSAFVGLLIRTIWNYHEQPEAFRSWLAAVEQAGVPVWNKVHTIRWNMEKTYLRDLAQLGLSVVPTVWLEKGETAVLANILSEEGWTEAVVKPVISASAYETWITNSKMTVSDQARFDKLVAQMAVMVQQKMPIEQGEWSLMFFAGEYSHGVLKRPKDGDFRVQEEYGGTSILTTAPDYLIEQAKHLLETAVPDTLYARIDGLELNGRFVLMELELIEPYLFLTFTEGAVERLAGLIEQALKNQLIIDNG